MCYNCGCNMPEDHMGVGHALKDPTGKSITEETFKILALQQKKTVNQTKQAALDQLEGKSNIKVISAQLMKNAAASQGMSIEVATDETIKLLKKELHIKAG